MAKKKASKSSSGKKRIAKKSAKKTTAPESTISSRSHRGKKSSIQQSAPVQIETSMDPSLQELVLKQREGRQKEIDASLGQATSDGKMLVDVLAKLEDPSADVPGLNVVRVIGEICTGQVLVDDLETVRRHANVKSLKLASRLHKNLVFSVPEIGASKTMQAASLPTGTSPFTGKGVIVGVVDYGCDFVHNNFRHADGTSRILFLWDQTGGVNDLSPVGFGYGRQFDHAAINEALTNFDPYFAIQYRPGAASHGTHVMDIAAGNGNATGNSGVAPEADLIFVNIAHDDLEVDEISDLGEGETINFGNSKMLLEAVDYIFTKAGELGRQAVVNISLGTNGGPHDGSTLAEQGFDVLLKEPARAIVVSAGNSHDGGGHASKTVSQAQPVSLGWQIGANDFTANEVEIWYPGSAEISVSITTPDGDSLASVTPGHTVTLSDDTGPVGRIVNRNGDPNNGDNQIDVVLSDRLKGLWEVNLTTNSAAPIRFHAWIERDDFGQSRFVSSDVDPKMTIGSISCGKSTIAAASYITSNRLISSFSAEGTTRDGKQKPEISAPGQALPGPPSVTNGILAARALSQSSTRKPGTSMASPHVAGVVALLMQAAGRKLNIDEIREMLFKTARKATTGANWDSRFGFGRVDAAAALNQLIGLAAVSAAPLVGAANAASAAPSLNGPISLQHVISSIADAANHSGTSMRFTFEVSPSTLKP